MCCGCRRSAPTSPGVTPQIADGLSSPAAWEYAGGGLYYQVGAQPNRLYTVNLPALTATPAPNDMGFINNFYDVGRDPTTGKLGVPAVKPGDALSDM